jgi:hypothetical protein
MLIVSKVAWSFAGSSIEKPCDWGVGQKLLPERVAGKFKKGRSLRGRPFWFNAVALRNDRKQLCFWMST